MKALLEDIINRFGGRLPASKQERDAQFYLKGVLEKFCDSVRVHEFSTATGAMFGSLKLFCSVFYVSLVLFWFHPAFALLVSAINTVLFIGHFVIYHHWLDFLFDKQDSVNIIGDVEPEEKPTATVIVSGHMDSTVEFIWWYRLKHMGMVLSVLSGFIITLFPLVCAAAVLQNALDITFPVSQILWWLFAVLSPITIVFFNIHGEQAVQGAQDNLSGIVIATEVGKYFAQNKLKHTRVRVLSFGCEEPGLRGSDAYAKAFKEELKKENAVCVNLDGIKDADKLTIVTAEPMVLARYTPSMLDKLETAFRSAAVPYIKTIIPVGGTDGVSLLRQGIPAVTIIGLSTDKLDPTYHTRFDVPACVDPVALEYVKNVVVRFIKDLDGKS